MRDSKRAPLGNGGAGTAAMRYHVQAFALLVVLAGAPTPSEAPTTDPFATGDGDEAHSPASAAALASDEAPSTETDERAEVSAIPVVDPTPAVRVYLARLHGREWTRFELLDLRWTDGEPVGGAVVGAISGSGDPAADGALVLYADVETGGDKPLRLPIAVTVRPWGRVPIAAREVPWGAPLGRGDVRVEEMPLLELRGARPSAGAMDGKVQGIRARRTIHAGEVLTDAAVEETPVVRMGDRVAIRPVSGSIGLVAKGIARRAGRPGDVIPVENVDSRRTVLASIVEAGVVEVSP